MKFGFSMVFFAVWPGGRRCANCRDAHFFERYCDESIFTWKTFKTTMEKTKKKVQTHGQGLGRGLAGDMGLNFLFFFPWFFAVWPKTQEHQKKQKKKFRPMGKVWAIHTQTKKPKNQKTKKPKKQKTKKTKKQNQKTKLCKPKKTKKQKDKTQHSACFLVFWFFCFFVFGFLVWIAIADVPSRDCQALSVVALEARSIHYSTAMFAMT